MLTGTLLGAFTFASILLHSSSAIAQDTVVAAMQESPLYETIFREIMAKTNLRTTFLIAPPKRVREMFVDGEINIECCIAPQWRTSEDEENSQIFSKPILISSERYILPKPHRSSAQIGPVNQPLLKQAVVFGFSYRHSPPGENIIVSYSVEKALHLVARGRADYTLLDELEFLGRMRLKPKPLHVGTETAELDLRIRIHNGSKWMLPIINDSIREVQHDLVKKCKKATDLHEGLACKVANAIRQVYIRSSFSHRP